MSEAFDLALIQLRVGLSKEGNLERAGRLVGQAAKKGAALVVLPEMFNCPYEPSYLADFAEEVPGGPTCRFLSSLAAGSRIHLIGGSIPEREGQAVYNTATLWDPTGRLLAKYRKVHLFDVNIPGGIVFTESRWIAPGDRLVLAQTELGAIGLAICYDLRFPEVFRHLALAGAELIVVPAAFNTTTGPAHWELLIRARAVENTIYLAACGPAPDPSVSYPAWGHSLVADPYGWVVASAGQTETVIYTTFDRHRLTQVRQALPVLSQRRPQAYD